MGLQTILWKYDSNDWRVFPGGNYTVVDVDTSYQLFINNLTASTFDTVGGIILTHKVNNITMQEAITWSPAAMPCACAFPSAALPRPCACPAAAPRCVCLCPLMASRFCACPFAAAPQAAAHGFAAVSQARPCGFAAPLLAAKRVRIRPHLGVARAFVAAPCVMACLPLPRLSQQSSPPFSTVQTQSCCGCPHSQSMKSHQSHRRCSRL